MGVCRCLGECEKFAFTEPLRGLFEAFVRRL